MLRRLRSKTRRTTFALHRSIWDASDTAGGHAGWGALAGTAGVVLTLLFIGRDELSVAFYGLAALGVATLLVVGFKFIQAVAHPQRHPEWQWLDFGVQEDVLRLGVRSLAPLRPRSGPEPELVVRVVDPDGFYWISLAHEDQSWASAGELRSYPADFKCPKCGLSPTRLLVGTYEVTWLKPSWGPFKRPLLRYTLQVPEHEQEPEPGERGS